MAGHAKRKIAAGAAADAAGSQHKTSGAAKTQRVKKAAQPDEAEAAEKKRPNKETQIRQAMESLGTWNDAYTPRVAELAKLERELARAEKAWRMAYVEADGKAREPQMIVTLIAKDGTPYRTKDPYYSTVEKLRKEVSAKQEQLGLTPKSAQRIKAQAETSAGSGPSKLERLLADAADVAVERAADYQAEVDAYVDSVLSGARRVCPEIRQACERWIRDLDNPKWEFRAEPANETIAIIETTICHQQGERLDATPLRGEPFVLLPYHKFIVYNIVGFYIRGTQERRFKEALDFVPRKNIKTTFAAALAWALALYERRSGSKVYEVGGALKQALEGFDFLRYNLRRLGITTDEDPVGGLRIINNNMERSISGDLGDGFISINALASSPDRHDSFNASIIIADELHTYKSAGQYQVLKDATKAYTNKLVIGISSGGRLSQGFCAKRVDYCRKILDGTITGPEADSIFVFIAAAEKDADGHIAYTSPEVLEACNPGWGESIRPQEMLNDAAQAQDDPQLRPEFFQKSLNVFTGALRAWFNIEEWRRSDQKYNWTIDELRKLPVKWYAGTDLAKLHDLCAAVLFTHYNGVDILIPHCWFPIVAAPAKAKEDDIPLFGWQDDGWLDMTNTPTTDHMEIVRYYEMRKKQGFRFDCIGHDRRFVRKYFIAMKQKGFPIKDIPQHFVKKSEGFRYLEASAKNGTLYYMHAEPMDYCVQNVHGTLEQDDMVKFEKVDEHHRIDVFDAAVFAVMAYLDGLDKREKAARWFSGSGKETA